jgi:uncharacterized protein YcfJ
MKNTLLLSVSMVSSGLCLAQDVGRVISATPVFQQLAVPHQVCALEQVAVPQPKSGAGALIGAIAGGAMGNAIGAGGGKAVATMIGLVGGSVIGDNLEGTPLSQTQNVQRCTTQTSYENRSVAYNVVYEFAGKQYSVQMPHDPGATVSLQITPVGAQTQTAAPAITAAYSQPVYVQTDNTYVAQPVYPAYYPGYYAQPSYLPLGIGLAFGLGYWSGGSHRGHHRHWR